MRSRTWHTESYRQYLKSPEWAARRRAYFKVHGYRCEACGSRKAITVHHTTYDNLKHEPDCDLRAACWPDHKNFHEAFNSGRFDTLEAATDYIINRGKRKQARHRRYEKIPLIGWLWR